MSYWKFGDSSAGEVIKYYLTRLFSGLQSTAWILQNRYVWSYCWIRGLRTGAIAHLLTTRIINCFQRGLFFSGVLEGSNTITHQALVFKMGKMMLSRPASNVLNGRWILLPRSYLVGRIQSENQNQPKSRLVSDNSLWGHFGLTTP